MASGPIASWQIDGEKMETVADFIFLGLKFTVDGNCSHEIKRQSFPGIKAMTGTSLVVQGLRLQAPNSGDTDLTPGQETISHELQLRVRIPQLKDLVCFNKDLVCHN